MSVKRVTLILMATTRGTSDEFNTRVECVVAPEPLLSLSIFQDISILRGRGN